MRPSRRVQRASSTAWLQAPLAAAAARPAAARPAAAGAAGARSELCPSRRDQPPTLLTCHMFPQSNYTVPGHRLHDVVLTWVLTSSMFPFRAPQCPKYKVPSANASFQVFSPRPTVVSSPSRLLVAVVATTVAHAWGAICSPGADAARASLAGHSTASYLRQHSIRVTTRSEAISACFASRSRFDSVCTLVATPGVHGSVCACFASRSSKCLHFRGSARSALHLIQCKGAASQPVLASARGTRRRKRPHQKMF